MHHLNASCLMFKIFFGELEYAQSASLEEAVSLALWLHRNSNRPHEVSVYNFEDDAKSIEFVYK